MCSFDTNPLKLSWSISASLELITPPPLIAIPVPPLMCASISAWLGPV